MSLKSTLIKGAIDAGEGLLDLAVKKVGSAFAVEPTAAEVRAAKKAADKLAAQKAAAAKKAADKLAAEKQAAAIKAAQAKRFSVTTKQVEADKARAAAARASKTKYAAIEPHPNPHPDLANFEFPQGAGLGGAHAIEHGVPIVGIKPSVAQASSGYSGLASSVPANRVVADVTETEMVPRIIRTPEEIAKQFVAGIPLVGDALTNGLIHNVNGRPQVGSTLAEGGPGYPRRMAFQGDPSAWASIGGVVSGIDNRRALAEDMFEGPVAGFYTRMGNTALDQTTAMMDLLGRQLAAGGVTKANLKMLDRKVKAIMGPDFAKSFIGFEKNPQAAAAQLNDINVVRMPQRTAIIQGLDSANAIMAGFPDIGANRVAATVPELLYAPEGASGYMISSLSENGGLRAGSNTPDIAHSNYPKKQTGEYFGGLEHSVPRELMNPSYFKAMHGSGYDPVQVHSYLYDRTPAEIKEAFGYDPRIQKFDQEWVDKNSKYLEDIAKYGHVPFAQGGLAVKPRQGRSSEPQSLAVRSPSKKASKARRAGN